MPEGSSLQDGLRVVRVGIVLGLVTLLFGFALGALFGAAEDMIKDEFATIAAASVGAGRVEGAEVGRRVKNGWTYLKRAHLHANGLGTLTLVAALLLAALDLPAVWSRWAALLLGAGGLGYSLFWAVGAFRVQAVGAAAKESLRWLAIPSTGALVVGLLLLLSGAAGVLYRAIR